MIFNGTTDLKAHTYCKDQNSAPLKIFYIGEFIPYNRKVADRGEFTSRILALKGGADSEAIDFFFQRLEPLLGYGFSITIAPSSDPANPPGGLFRLVGKLASNNRDDVTACLVRHTRIPPMALSGVYKTRTDVNKHLESISVQHADLIKGREVLLMDDISTTGTTLRACEKLLLDAGASKVVCLALGKTQR